MIEKDGSRLRVLNKDLRPTTPTITVHARAETKPLPGLRRADRTRTGQYVVQRHGRHGEPEGTGKVGNNGYTAIDSCKGCVGNN